MAYNYPYGDSQQLNLAWFIEQWETFRGEWKEAEEGIDGALNDEIARVESAMEALYAARDAAAASATAAASSATAAGTAKNLAEQYKDTALSASNTANNSATAAQRSAESASGSSESAATSASNAASSARTATQQANGAASQAAAAQGYANDASDYADAAAASATASAGSATAAAGSATAAENSAQDAQDVLDSIPADYTTLSNDVGDLKNAFETNLTLDKTDARNAYPNKGIGNTLSFTDSTASITYNRIIPVTKNKKYKISVQNSTTPASTTIRDFVVVDSTDMIIGSAKLSTTAGGTDTVEFISRANGYLVLCVDLNYINIVIAEINFAGHDDMITNDDLINVNYNSLIKFRNCQVRPTANVKQTNYNDANEWYQRYLNLLRIHWNFTGTNLRFPLTGDYVSNPSSSAPNYSARKEWYVDDIPDFIVGHVYEFNAEVIDGETGATPNFVLFTKDGSLNKNVANHATWTCNIKPQLVALNLNKSGGENYDVTFYWYIVDKTLEAEKTGLNAILNCFQHVAWTDADGQTYYNALANFANGK